jgi:hypothetical protein
MITGTFATLFPLTGALMAFLSDPIIFVSELQSAAVPQILPVQRKL